MNRSKIAIVETVGGHGGNEFYDFGLCEFLSKDGVDVYLYTCSETHLDEEFNFSFVINKFFKGIYGRKNKFLRGLRFLKGSIHSVLHAKKNSIDIAHFHVYHFSILELFNILLFKIFGFQVLATIHDVHSFDKFESRRDDGFSLKTYLIMNICKMLLVHSDVAKNSLTKISKNPEKIRLVLHGDTDFVYNINKIPPQVAKSRVNINPDHSFILLFFGQIKSVKGLDVLLKSIPFMDSRVVLYVVGKCWKQDLNKYLSLVNKLGIDNRVHFINKYIHNKDVPFYFWSANAVCLPYIKIYSSGVVLRAMDYGCPVVCSDLDPLKAVISHGVTGLLFQSENPKDLATKVNYLIQNPSLSRKISINAKSFVDNEYSWTKVANETHKIYKELL